MADDLAAELARISRRLSALETAPRAPLTDRLAERDKVLTYSPVGLIEGTATTAWTDWFTIGDLVVPAWATGAFAVVSIGPASHTGTFGTTQMRLAIGGKVLAPVMWTSWDSSDLRQLTWGAVAQSPWSAADTTGEAARVKVQSRSIDGGQVRVWDAYPSAVGLSVSFF